MARAAYTTFWCSGRHVERCDMKPSRSRDEDNWRRHPVPWPRRVEIKALLFAGFIILWGIFIVFDF